MEQSENDATRLLETVRLMTEFSDTIEHQASLIADMSLTLAELDQSWGDSEESTDSVLGAAALASSSAWRREKMRILRKLVMLAKSSLSVLQQLGQSVQRFGGPTVTVKQAPSPHFTFDGVKAVEHPSLEEGLVAREYQFKIMNAEETLSVEINCFRKKWAEIVVWHRRDTYLEVVFRTAWSVTGAYFHLTLRCVGLHESSRLISPQCDVIVLNADAMWNDVMWKSGLAPSLEPNSCCCVFWTQTEVLNNRKFLQDGNLRFKLVIYDETSDELKMRTADSLRTPNIECIREMTEWWAMT